ncbi:hypothetical protein Q9L41_00530 [Vibrio cholerae]|nr:hypothetical protein [Vibrio cholerae]MDP4494395.1 hypothetical protein [Vibrio cholerae]
MTVFIDTGHISLLAIGGDFITDLVTFGLTSFRDYRIPQRIAKGIG